MLAYIKNLKIFEGQHLNQIIEFFRKKKNKENIPSRNKNNGYIFWKLLHLRSTRLNDSFKFNGKFFTKRPSRILFFSDCWLHCWICRFDLKFNKSQYYHSKNFSTVSLLYLIEFNFLKFLKQCINIPDESKNSKIS